MLTFMNKEGISSTSIIYKHLCEDFLVNEEDKEGLVAGRGNSGFEARQVPGQLSDEQMSIVVQDQSDDEDKMEDTLGENSFDSLLGNDLKELVSKMDSQTREWVCRVKSLTDTEEISFLPSPSSLKVSIPDNATKSLRRGAHEWVQSRYSFLKTRFDSTSSCIEISSDTVLRPLAEEGLRPECIDALMRFYRAGPSHGTAKQGVEIAHGIDRQSRTRLYAALSSACPNLEGCTVSRPSKTPGESQCLQSVVVTFRSNTQKRALVRRAVTASCVIKFELGKRDWEHMRLQAHLSQMLELSAGALSFAGIKDKRAVTWQFSSIVLRSSMTLDDRNCAESGTGTIEEAARSSLRRKASAVCLRLLGMSSSDLPVSAVAGDQGPAFAVRNLHFVTSPLTRGRLRGNKFALVLRNVDASCAQRLQKRTVLLQEQGFINYYGAQRLGIVSEPNGSILEVEETTTKEVEGDMQVPTAKKPTESGSIPPGPAIGALLIQGRYSAAARAILLANSRLEAAAYRQVLLTKSDGGNLQAVLEAIPAVRPGLDRERALVQALIRFGCRSWTSATPSSGSSCDNYDNDNDDDENQRERFRHALQSSLPFSMRQLWINAYQSWLWNKAASARAALGADPLPGDLVMDQPQQKCWQKFDEDGLGETVETTGPTECGGVEDAESTSSVRVVTVDELLMLSREKKAELAFRVVLPLFGTRVQHAEHAVGLDYRKALIEQGLPAGFGHVSPSQQLKRPLHPWPKGAYRRIFEKPQDLHFAYDQKTFSASIEFALTAGSYATSLLRELAEIDIIM